MMGRVLHVSALCMKNFNIISTGKEINGILWEIKQRFCCRSSKTAV